MIKPIVRLEDEIARCETVFAKRFDRSASVQMLSGWRLEWHPLRKEGVAWKLFVSPGVGVAVSHNDTIRVMRVTLRDAPLWLRFEAVHHLRELYHQLLSMDLDVDAAMTGFKAFADEHENR